MIREYILQQGLNFLNFQSCKIRKKKKKIYWGGGGGELLEILMLNEILYLF